MEHFYDLEKKNQLVDIGRCHGNCRRNDGTSLMVRFLGENSTTKVVFFTLRDSQSLSAMNFLPGVSTYSIPIRIQKFYHFRTVKAAV